MSIAFSFFNRICRAKNAYSSTSADNVPDFCTNLFLFSTKYLSFKIGDTFPEKKNTKNDGHVDLEIAVSEIVD